MKSSTKLLALFTLLALPFTVRADSNMDRKIEDAAKASYNYRSVLHDNVKISVHDGVVKLTGTVPDRDQKALAEDTVESLPGVVRVDNRIKVDVAPAEHSDEWMALKIRTRLAVKSNVRLTKTSVKVQGGVVTLTGTADSMAQKELTEAYAREIDGVKDVRNQITVNEPIAQQDTQSAPRPTGESPAKVTNGTRDAGDVMDDASITGQVKYALLTHRSTSALKTNVTTKDGAVTISGVAGSDAEKALTTELARNVSGVKSVDNQMTVK